ncbi:MAG: hypothetical protein Q4C54_09480 [Clostridia bacterium]|nr:hypothetical protein [Clostridia bacterium]
MNGYDKAEAIRYILAHLDKKEVKAVADSLEEYVSLIIDADQAYMLENDVLDEEGYAGDGYYDDDDALEYILAKMEQSVELTPDRAMALVVLVSRYLELNQEFLEQSGLVSYE